MFLQYPCVKGKLFSKKKNMKKLMVKMKKRKKVGFEIDYSKKVTEVMTPFRKKKDFGPRTEFRIKGVKGNKTVKNRRILTP